MISGRADYYCAIAKRINQSTFMKRPNLFIDKNIYILLIYSTNQRGYW